MAPEIRKKAWAILSVCVGGEGVPQKVLPKVRFFWSSVQHFASSLFEGSQGIHSYPRQQHVSKLGNVFTILFPCLLSSIVMLVLDAWVSRVYSGTGNLGDKHAFMLPKFLWRECGYHFVLNTNSRDAQQIVVQHGCNTI